MHHMRSEDDLGPLEIELQMVVSHHGLVFTTYDL